MSVVALRAERALSALAPEPTHYSLVFAGVGRRQFVSGHRL